jgi:hypothetical protein
MAEPATVCGSVPKGVFDRDWLCDDLAIFGEPDYPLHAGAMQTFRLLYSCSFDPEILIRIDMMPDGSAVVTAKERGVHESAIRISREVKVGASDVAELREILTRDSFWNAPSLYDLQLNFGAFPVNSPTNAVVMSDGAVWFIEGADRGRYHIMADDGGAFESPVQRIGLALLNLAKKKIPALDVEPIY